MAEKILVVDDEHQIVDMVKMRLEANGYEVLTANDGEEGLKKAKQYKPSLIILDIWMPKIGGDEMAEALKNDVSTSDIPIIFLTCLAEGIIDDQQEFKRGGNIFLAKPFDAEKLLLMVKRLIKK